ncbi:MAG: PIN domain-containing protein [Halobacteriales archaeon]|nr:PIN domain-containing protein [Halobacteriales archaeon]
MKVADTSALYALFRENDAHHAKAKAQLASGEAIVIPAEILTETLCLIQMRVGFAPARAAAAFLASTPCVEVQPTHDEPWDDILGEAGRCFADAGGRLSRADAVVVAWSRKRGLAAWSYDKELLAATS